MKPKNRFSISRLGALLVGTVALAATTTTAVAQTPTPWDNGVIYFEFANSYSGSQKEHCRRAMDTWSKTNVDVVFLPRNGANRPYIKFDDNGGNNANIVGQPSGSIFTTVNVSSLGFNDIWFPVHELGHVLGFYHEMSRDDRDAYIDIHLGNINNNDENQYDKRPESDWLYSLNAYPFNFNSIMMYSQCFDTNEACDGCPNDLDCNFGGVNMTALSPNEDKQDTMGTVAFHDNNDQLYSADINRGVAVYGSGKVRYVNNNSGDASQGTLEKPYTTFGTARDNAPQDARVYVKGNTYNGAPMTLRRRLTWRAYPNETATIK